MRKLPVSPCKRQKGRGISINKAVEDFHQLVKSANRLSWAISLFGIQQLGTAISRNGSAQPGKDAARMTTSECRLDDLFGNINQSVNQTPPDQINDLISSALALRTFTPRYITRAAFEMMLQSADFFKYFSS